VATRWPDSNSLRGKRIGFVDSAWAYVFGPATPPFGTDPAIDAMRNALKYIVQARGTIVRGRWAPGAEDDAGVAVRWAEEVETGGVQGMRRGNEP
jgi:hypothetical protein